MAALRLLGRGNEHAVWRYDGQEPSLACCVLRVRHSGRGEEQCTALPALAAMLSPFVHAPLATLRISKDVATQLCESAARGADPTVDAADAAAAAMVAALSGDPDQASCACERVTFACVERDHTRVESSLDGLCVELKPKAGVFPPRAPLDAVTPQRCRFCLYGELKAQRKQRASSANAPPPPPQLPAAPVEAYCPIDMYSAEPARLARAVSALVRHPKNNLRVVDAQNAKLLHGDARAGATKAAASSASSSAQDGRLSTSFSPAFIEAIVCAVLADAPARSLLSRLLAAQHRAAIGSAQAMALYERGVQLAGTEEALQARIVAHQAACTCAGVACACACATVDKAVGESTCELSLDECTRALSEWLLGLAASDVSLMLSLCHAPPQAAAGAGHAHARDVTAPSTPPRTVTVALGGACGDTLTLCYRLAVVDIASKPPHKIREHAQLDHTIVEHWRHRAAAHDEAAHGCEPLPLRAPSRKLPLLRSSGRGGATLVVAFGTRGDVLPLLALARSAPPLAQQPVLFATHECYRELVLDGAASTRAGTRGGDVPCAPTREGLRFIGVCTDPLRPHAHTPQAGCAPFPTDGDAANPVDVEYGPVLAALHELSVPIDLVVFNLFSLGAWHIAEALGSRAVAVSPCIVPYAHPTAFPRAFAEAHPGLHAALHRAPVGRIHWADVAAWMWPLWDVGRWGEWRVRALDLGPTPLSPPVLASHQRGGEADSGGVLMARLPMATPLLYAISPALVPRPAYWPASVQTVGSIVAAEDGSTADERCARHAPATHDLVTRAGLVNQQNQAAQAAGASAVAAVDATHRPLYVGFGSSSPLLLEGPAPLADAIACAALEAARVRECGLLLHCCGCSSLLTRWCDALVNAGCVHADPAIDQTNAERCLVLHQRRGDVSGPTFDGSLVRVVVVRDDLPLEWVLSRCLAVVHHGGAGTCVAAVRAGTPQLILPLIFDQFATAERIEHACLGARLRRDTFSAAPSSAAPSSGHHRSGHHRSGAAELLRGLTAATDPTVMMQLDITQRVLLAENGLATASAILAADHSSSPEADANAAHAPAQAVGPILAAARAWKRAREEPVGES